MTRQSLSTVFLILGIAAVAVSGALGACAPRAVATPTPSPTATAVTSTVTATPTLPAAPTQWIKVVLPANATQLQYGAEVYRLVCQDCHGDKGQGLTGEWRAAWAPADQNCWQSKCHGFNHPPDGFYLPIAPHIVGRDVLAHYTTAQDLHYLIQTEMPWYDPGILSEKDGWAVTAHVLQMNGINPGPSLGVENASSISLK